MNLPTQAQVNAATRHVASFAAGAIAVFGLSTKFDPATIQQIIAATGTFINDGILLIGLVSPVIAATFAAKSASPASQANAVQAAVADPNIPITPEVKAVIINTANEVLKQ